MSIKLMTLSSCGQRLYCHTEACDAPPCHPQGASAPSVILRSEATKNPIRLRRKRRFRTLVPKPPVILRNEVT